MNNRKGFVKIFAMASVLCISMMQAKAVDEKYAALPLTGSSNQIAKDSSSIVQDTSFYNMELRPNQTTFSVKNYITFKLDEFANIALPDTFKVTITFKVYFTRLSGSTPVLDSSALQTMYVEYNQFRNYQGKSVYTFSGGFSSQVKIFSVTSSSSAGTFDNYKNALQLQNEIVVSREYAFKIDSSAVKAIAGAPGLTNDPDACSSTGEFKVSWGKIREADEYDLEWTYIDSTAITNYYLPGTTTIEPAKIFYNNASRVSIARENYTIPLLYDNGGILFYRVRSVQVRQSGQRIANNWSSLYAGGMGMFGFGGHERSLNWQASTGFAEEGKRKSVIQYFDGTLRNRQTVTKDNSTCNTVVAESFYDFQGRPVINVMPAPTLNRLIAYTPNFNRAINQPGYEKTVYDGDAGNGVNPCGDLLGGMDTSSGASKYYSANNPVLGQTNPGFAKYIPDARLYPYTETRYTADNTGRVLMQSGVGKEFAINQPDANGRSHETRYFYGSADQEELDGLFGTEVGNASHYSKNMVKDANGQYSVSYTDMHGRTIATALAGKPESNLDTLASYNEKTIIKKLLDSTSNLVSGTSIISSKSLLVTSSGPHRFQYSLLPDSISINDCSNTPICYDCLYDLEITISNDCSNPANAPLVITRTNLSPSAFVDTICNANTAFPAVDTTVNLTEGSYMITKKLSISQRGLAAYNEIFMRRNTCKTLQQFIDEQKQLLLSSISCYPTCQACVDSLGTWTSYREKYMQQQGISAADSAAFREQAWMAYTAQKEACDDLCSNTGLHTSIRQQMLADMTAPYGQYADPDNANDPHSIFYTSSGTAGLRFKTVTTPFVNEFGQPDSMMNAAGLKVPPTHASVTAAEFEDNFKNTWPQTLLPLHPEYCKLVKYESYAASHLWDERFGKVETFKEAVDSGFLNPANFGGLPVMSNPAFTYNSAHRDPFFTDLEPGQKTAMSNALFNFIPASGSTPAMNAWSLATIMAHCGNDDAACTAAFTSIGTAFTIDTACRGELDFAWRYFREMYLTQKAFIIDDLVFNNCPDNGILPSHNLNFPHIVPVLGQDGLAANATGGADSLNKFIDDNCRAYVSQWWAEMKPCNFTAADSVIIIPRLINVCKEGGDASHIYGSSTVKPSSTYQYRSFEDVLVQYGKLMDSTCNAYLITAPGPYDKQPAYGDIDVWNKPDSCQCSKISSLYQQYQQTAVDTSFASYVYRITGTRMYPGVLDTLRKLCSGEINCKFLATPMVLPPVLQCNTSSNCVSCTQFNTVYNGFKTAFPGIMPAYSSNDSMQQSRNRLFELYMNYHLGFAKTTIDYLQFMDTCSLGYGNQVSAIPCSTLTTVKNNFLASYSGSWPAVVTDGAGCDISTWLVTDAAPTVTRAQMFHDGTVGFPMVNGQPYLNHNVYMAVGYGLQFCNPDTSGYVLEARIKLAFDTVETSAFRAFFFYVNYTDSITGAARSSYVRMLPTGTIYTTGYYTNPRTGSDTGVASLLQDLSHGYRTVKVVVKPHYIDVYLDGVLLQTVPVRGRTWNNFVPALQFQSCTGTVDWIKYSGLSGNLVFDEQFNNGCSSFVRPSPAYNCAVNCVPAFTTYFNQQLSTNYTYTQISNLYSVACQQALQLCWQPAAAGPMLCGNIDAVFPPAGINDLTPCADSTLFSVGVGTKLYDAYRDSLRNSFNNRYLQKCLAAYKTESFTVTAPISEFHYTLYYYDQAGNLVKTVPPAGVDVSGIGRQSYLDSVATARINGTTKLPGHSLYTQYRYNTLGQVTAQQSPDGGQSRFWYDRLGRLVISQNAKQKANSSVEQSRLYSYTQYDYLGRIAEVGEISNINSAEPVTDALTRNNTTLANWLAARSGVRTQITNSYYDTKYTGFAGSESSTIWQRNLRNRVSYTTYTDLASLSGYNQATFYSYDIHGNVDTLLQDYGATGVKLNVMNVQTSNANRWKRMVYQYDLISGKVNHVAYQPPRDTTHYPDMLYHRYSYDAENRLTLAETSTDSVIWEKDSRYEYYKHGPLARMVLGDQLVQGTDYAYTLQGWLKGVNSTALQNGANDMGADGVPGETNQYTARDALGFALNYFAGEYQPINTAVSPFPGHSAYLPAGQYKPLYNGNISSMAVNIAFPNATAEQAPQLYNYSYDQLNRITGMDVYRGLNQANNSWAALTTTTDYKERVSYDGNGNILTYLRNGVGTTSTSMDKLTYNYIAGTNQLKYVQDSVTDAAYADDIDDQSTAGNYTYDPIGNLTSDAKDSITLVKWNVYGKITEIQRTASAARPVTNIQYTYDAAGNRISKKVAKTGTSTVEYTWYVRDASGNVMAVYNSTGAGNISSAGYTLNLTEQHLYGSSRLGVLNRNISVKTAFTNPGMVTFTRGNKFFELSNHLGNVLVTVSDKKTGVDDGTYTTNTLGVYTKVNSTPDGKIDYYTADVITANDYTPFGALLSGRKYKAVNALSGRYGFGGKEKDNEDYGEGNAYDYGARIYNPRLGRWLSTDIVTKSFISPYNYASNNPINYLDPDGQDNIHFYHIVLRQYVDGKLLIAKTYKYSVVEKNSESNVFVHHQITLRYDGVSPEKPTTNVQVDTRFYPDVPGSKSGLTSDKAIWVIPVKDEDRKTLIKFVDEYSLSKQDVDDNYTEIAASGTPASDRVKKAQWWGEIFAEKKTIETAAENERVKNNVMLGVLTLLAPELMLSRIGRGTEMFYRTMSEADALIFESTGMIPAGTETMISPTLSYAKSLKGVTFQINTKAGTVSKLLEIGVSDGSALTSTLGLQQVQKGWKVANAFFKAESNAVKGLSPQINIGLGNGQALKTFNANILSYIRL